MFHSGKEPSTALASRARPAIPLAGILVLALAVAGFALQGQPALRTRPWHLEAFVQAQVARCHAVPGTNGFDEDIRKLKDRAEAAGACLRLTDQRSWIRRDYSPCVEDLLSIGLDAYLIRLRQAQRALEHRTRLVVLVGSLEREMGPDDGNGDAWSRYEIRNIDRKRARNLVRQARFLGDSGQVESALVCAMRAWSAWRSFNRTADSELARFQDPSLREQWDSQAESLLRWTRETGRRAILVSKLEHHCYLLVQGRIEKTYDANLGRNWHRPKLRERDASTPEGQYKVIRMIRAGKYGFALLLNYPTQADWRQFRDLKRNGILDRAARIGGNIEIHGGGRSGADWTDGCVSLSDDDMGDLYGYAYQGMPVTIVGTCRISASSRDGLTGAN